MLCCEPLPHYRQSYKIPSSSTFSLTPQFWVRLPVQWLNSDPHLQSWKIDYSILPSLTEEIPNTSSYNELSSNSDPGHVSRYTEKLSDSVGASSLDPAPPSGEVICASYRDAFWVPLAMSRSVKLFKYISKLISFHFPPDKQHAVYEPTTECHCNLSSG